MSRYIATTPILHDGKRYKEGDDVPVSGLASASLLEAGAVRVEAPAVEQAPAAEAPAVEQAPAAEDAPTVVAGKKGR